MFNFWIRFLGFSKNEAISKQDLTVKNTKQYCSPCKFTSIEHWNGERGGVVVKTLRYKPAGRGFDSRSCHWKFSLT